jgi:hypothetical protein
MTSTYMSLSPSGVGTTVTLTTREVSKWNQWKTAVASAWTKVNTNLYTENNPYSHSEAWQALRQAESYRVALPASAHIHPIPLTDLPVYSMATSNTLKDLANTQLIKVEDSEQSKLG